MISKFSVPFIRRVYDHTCCFDLCDSSSQMQLELLYFMAANISENPQSTAAIPPGSARLHSFGIRPERSVCPQHGE
jgi:hypothetical protein